MGDYNATFKTDGNAIPGEGVFDQTSQANHLKQGYGPVTTGANGASQAQAVGMLVATTNTALSSPPGTTNAGSDTTLTFTAQVLRWCLQNNSSAVFYYNLDAAASTSTIALQPGAMVWWDWPVTAVHVYTAAAINVNGANGLVLMGRAY